MTRVGVAADRHVLARRRRGRRAVRLDAAFDVAVYDTGAVLFHTVVRPESLYIS